MTKEHFIALADHIRAANQAAYSARKMGYTQEHIESLADFCAAQNPAFMRSRWLAYVNGKGGKNGGKV